MPGAPEFEISATFHCLCMSFLQNLPWDGAGPGRSWDHCLMGSWGHRQVASPTSRGFGFPSTRGHDVPLVTRPTGLSSTVDITSASFLSPALDPSPPPPPNDTSVPSVCLRGCLGHGEELNNSKLSDLSSKTSTLGVSSPDRIPYCQGLEREGQFQGALPIFLERKRKSLEMARWWARLPQKPALCAATRQWLRLPNAKEVVLPRACASQQIVTNKAVRDGLPPALSEASPAPG